MIRVGVIGLGMMGRTHLDVYAERDDVEVVAISDRNRDKLEGKTQAAGNIEGQAQGGFDLSTCTHYLEPAELIADDRVDLVDVCLPTPMHLPLGQAVLEAGQHLLMEKPLARNYADAIALAEAAERAHGDSGALAMPAMCMRFWPGWTWLKQAVGAGTLGSLKSLHLHRVTSHPPGRFYRDHEANGGGILDLHLHDTDFVCWLLGAPSAVSTTGHAGESQGIDYITTQYRYAEPGAPVVTAHGAWTMTQGFGFEMKFLANFEKATAVFDLASDPVLKLVEPGGDWQAVAVEDAMGYALEIDHFLKAIQANRKPSVSTMRSAAESIRVVEAELQSITTGQVVPL